MRARSAFAAVAVLALAGCSQINTIVPYNPGDGVLVDLGEGVHGSNFMFVSDGDQASFIGALTNAGSSPATVKLGLSSSDDLTVDLDPGATTYFGPDHEEVLVDSLDVEAGDWADVQVSTTSAGTVTVQVPVMDTSLPQYADVLP